MLDQCGEGIPFAKVMIQSEEKNALTDLDGAFLISNVQSDSVLITVRAAGYAEFEEWTKIDFNAIEIRLVSELQHLDAVVITATLKEISKKESTVNVEVLSPKFFKKNPTPSIYDALQNVNGVRPQLNCNICNTGDIHINGLEGPYTMVLIDGMPIVSSLSTVYGLSGIPSALIEQVEIVKGPSSTLYGSEAIGGIINIITKKSSKAPTVYADVHTTSWLETNADIGFKLQFGDRNAEERKNNVLSTYIEKKPMLEVLTGINYFNYDWKRDLNNDGFTDLTLQDRISIFQKYKVNRKDNRVLSFAARYLHEDRWGGELDWTPQFRGGDSIYGESIYTSRWELIGKYQLPFKERIFLSGSLNQHAQNSFYGNTSYMANQLVGFGQLHWDKRIGKHDLIVGAAYRYINYDDDNPATEFILNNTVLNNEDVSSIYGVFVQDEIRFNSN